jgi:hypothetical protein
VREDDKAKANFRLVDSRREISHSETALTGGTRKIFENQQIAVSSWQLAKGKIKSRGLGDFG